MNLAAGAFGEKLEAAAIGEFGGGHFSHHSPNTTRLARREVADSRPAACWSVSPENSKLGNAVSQAVQSRSKAVTSTRLISISLLDHRHA
jgi:hypothetical protein